VGEDKAIDGRLIIGGKRVDTQEKIPSINPSNLNPIGTVSLANTEDCQAAIQEAKRAFPLWKELTPSAKSGILRKAKSILLRKSSDIARLIAEEHGSPFSEALSVEIWTAAEALDYYRTSLKKILEPRKMSSRVLLLSHKKNAFHFQPLGPTLVISPWNFPFMLPFLDVLSALSSGHTVVLRPSSTTPFSALQIGEIFLEAGLPPGVLNIVNSKTAQAEEMIANPDIQSIMFTGSASIGKRIMELASRNLTNLILELGGKDPMVVFEDADLDRAARGAAWAGLMNCGQSCGSVERIYVAQEIAAKFTEKLLELVTKLQVGNPLDPGVDIGPMTTQSQREVVLAHIADAVEKGARVLHGGRPTADLPGYFIQPAVLDRVDHSMTIMREETFGPVLPIMTFADRTEALALANDSPYGLTASVWTRDKEKARWMAQMLETGTVTINDHMCTFSDPKGIWGGIKQSGIGRSHGWYGLLNLVNIKLLSQDFKRKKNQLWWFPYEEGRVPFLKTSLTIVHHERTGAKLKAMFALFPFITRIAADLPLSNVIKSIPRFFKK
jgi:succinate-semialdehyde dehydrogenase/glutarate-semialdehyde dehydrogenase